MSAFFAACEAAFFSLSSPQLADFKNNRGKTGKLIARLLENPKKLLITIYIGNELVNVATSAITTSIALKLFGDWGVAMAIGIGTFLILLFGEVVPKSLSITFAERFAFMAARPLNLFSGLVQPAQSRLTVLAEKMIGAMGLQVAHGADAGISEQELRTMVELGEGHGVIDAEEREMIHNVIEFGEKTISEVMTPKIDMFTLKPRDTLSEILPQIVENFYSRVPVYDEEGTHILGILFTKDLIRFKHLPEEKFKLKNVIRPAIFVPENKKINEMLQDFKKLKRHMAIVLDEFGSVCGLVTLEDIVEELVGEIDSEMRVEEQPWIQLNENQYRLSGTYNINEFNEHFGCQLPNGEISTIGGFVFGLFGRIPRSGETIVHENFKFRIEKMKGPRIINIHLTHLPPELLGESDHSEKS